VWLVLLTSCYYGALLVELLRGKRYADRFLVEKPEGKRLLARLRRRWEDNIQLDLKRSRMRWRLVDSCGSRRGQLDACCGKGLGRLLVPENSGNFLIN
jgi:hypothetical protein